MPEDIMTAQRAEYDELDLEGGFTELETEKYLIFLSGGIYYGVDTKYVKEMLTQWETSITWLPMLPPHVKGVINLRGGVVPIVDFRLLMGQMPGDKFCTVILDMGGVQMGADGSLVVHGAVDVEEASGDQNKAQGGSKEREGGAQK